MRRSTVVRLVAVVVLIAGLAAMSIGAYLQGAQDNRVTPQDMAAYTACMAYYHNASHCYQDTIASWQH